MEKMTVDDVHSLWFLPFFHLFALLYDAMSKLLDILCHSTFVVSFGLLGWSFLLFLSLLKSVVTID